MHLHPPTAGHQRAASTQAVLVHFIPCVLKLVSHDHGHTWNNHINATASQGIAWTSSLLENGCCGGFPSRSKCHSQSHSYHLKPQSSAAPLRGWIWDASLSQQCPWLDRRELQWSFRSYPAQQFLVSGLMTLGCAQMGSWDIDRADGEPGGGGQEMANLTVLSGPRYWSLLASDCLANGIEYKNSHTFHPVEEVLCQQPLKI